MYLWQIKPFSKGADLVWSTGMFECFPPTLWRGWLLYIPWCPHACAICTVYIHLKRVWHGFLPFCPCPVHSDTWRLFHLRVTYCCWGYDPVWTAYGAMRLLLMIPHRYPKDDCGICVVSKYFYKAALWQLLKVSFKKMTELNCGCSHLNSLMIALTKIYSQVSFIIQ